MSEVTAVPLRPVGKSGIVALWIGVTVLIAAGIGGAVYSSQAARMVAVPPAQFLAANAKRHGIVTTPSGLEYQVLKPGSGPRPGPTDLVRIEYAGSLLSGVQFDASPKGQPRAMPVNRVVPGFSEALQLMPKGSRMRVWLPPQLAYGEEETGPIPANSVLVFDITMVDFMAVPEGMSLPGM